MKVYRKLYSAPKEEKKTESLENKGIAAGSVMAGIGAASYGLGKLPQEYVNRHGATVKLADQIGVKGARNLKVAGAVLVPVGATLAGVSYYKKKKKKKGDETKA